LKIQIIDDEKNICLTLKGILEDEGYTVQYATSGAEGLKLYDQFQPDLIMLDVKMEQLDGMAVLSTIMKYDKTLPVIMISGNSNISDAVQAIKIGAYDFLEKPLSLPKIKIVVQKALAYRQMTENYKEMKETFSAQYRIIGESKPIRDLNQIIDKVAQSQAKVLIRGESGTGKELIAWAIHHRSTRAAQQFVKFNSAAIPRELVESELFGHEKGAFTGAVQSKKGKIEMADGGTLFLDEIGDMDLQAQAKILRVIQQGEFERVGSTVTQKIDARIIAATHKDLEQMVKNGEFREDLYYRLNVVPIHSPALREHAEDIPLLIQYFSNLYAIDMKVKAKEFTQAFLNEIQVRQFAGNVRELRNLIERIYILCENDIIDNQDLCLLEQRSGKEEEGFWLDTQDFTDKKREFEIRYLKTQLLLHENSISKTAEALNLQQSNLSRKLKELDIH
jgi:two-component system, NtrC family, nitrogen regulation response regulator NtrX